MSPKEISNKAQQATLIINPQSIKHHKNKSPSTNVSTLVQQIQQNAAQQSRQQQHSPLVSGGHSKKLTQNQSQATSLLQVAGHKAGAQLSQKIPDHKKRASDG